MVERLVVGRHYRALVDVPLRRWCMCDCTIPTGMVFRVEYYASKNRVVVVVPYEGLLTYHKARSSTLRQHVEDA